MAHSDDDMANYESDDVEYYNDDDDLGPDNDDNYPDDDQEDGKKSNPQVEFGVLTSEDIRRRVDEAASEIASLLSVSTSEVVLLLCKYKWEPSQIYNEWFSDEAKTRKSCGLMVSSSSSDGMKTDEFFCGVCLDDFDGVSEDDLGMSASCGHVFCKTCWRAYVSTSVTDGPGCLSLRCPQPKCGASAVGMIETFQTDSDRKKFEDHVLRSYVESRKNMKWCPSPGCEYIIECEFREFGASHLDVTCKCKYSFCLNCSEENHSPSDCALVAKWTLKNSSESENKNWIIVNTKPCPKCGKSIEKNAGCMHMTCAAPCRFQFCWICLKPYENHSGCNRYEDPSGKNNSYSRAQHIREKAQSELNKYIHFHDRWSENDKSRKKAMESLKTFQEEHKKPLSDSLWATEKDLQSITDAWTQVVECRRVLKWSYAYGYYIQEDDAPKKLFFEFTQGQAEAALEKLHNLVENEALKHITEAMANCQERANLGNDFNPADSAKLDARENVARDEFKTLSNEAKRLTNINRDHFDTLVDALARDLEMVKEDKGKLDKAFRKALAKSRKDVKEMLDRDLETALARSLEDFNAQANHVEDGNSGAGRVEDNNLWTNPAQLMYYFSDEYDSDDMPDATED